MPILKTTYYSYLPELEKAKKRIQRDRKIIKYIMDMIKTKRLSENAQEKLNELLKEVTA